MRLDRFIARLEMLLPLLSRMEEDSFREAFERDIGLLRNSDRAHRKEALRDIEGMLREGSGTLADRYVTRSDGSPDVEASQLFRRLVVRIRSDARWHRTFQL